MSSHNFFQTSFLVKRKPFLSAVTLAGAYLSLMLHMCIHSSEDTALNSKQQGLNLENNVELIFDPDYDGDISVTNLTVMCITDMTSKNSQLHYIKGCKGKGLPQ